MSDVIQKMVEAAAEQKVGQQSYQDTAEVMSRVLIEDMKLWAMENRKDPTFVPSYAKSRGIE